MPDVIKIPLVLFAALITSFLATMAFAVWIGAY
jgi:hypothetical protein